MATARAPKCVSIVIMAGIAAGTIAIVSSWSSAAITTGTNAQRNMRGDAAAVVAALGEMHDAGADPVVILQDMVNFRRMKLQSFDVFEYLIGVTIDFDAAPDPGHLAV